MEVEHREVAYGPLRLSALRGEDDVAGVLAKSDEIELFCLDDHAERLTPVAPGHDLGVPGVVSPVDPGPHVDGRRVADGRDDLLQRVEHVGSGGSLAVRERSVEQEVPAVERRHCLGMRRESQNEKEDSQVKSCHTTSI